MHQVMFAAELENVSPVVSVIPGAVEMMQGVNLFFVFDGDYVREIVG